MGHWEWYITNHHKDLLMELWKWLNSSSVTASVSGVVSEVRRARRIYRNVDLVRENKGKLKLVKWIGTYEHKLENILTSQHPQLSNFNDTDDLQKRLVLFVKSINTYLAQESEALGKAARADGGGGSPVTASCQQGESAVSRHHTWAIIIADLTPILCLIQLLFHLLKLIIFSYGQH